MNAVVAWMRGMPLLARWAGIGAISAGVAGGIVGLVVGLFVYAPTALFAAFELGFPAMLAGGIVGLVAGLIMTTVRSRDAGQHLCSSATCSPVPE